MCNGGWRGFVSMIRTLHGYPLFAGFVGLQWTEARLIKNKLKF